MTVFNNLMVKNDLYNQVYKKIKILETDGTYQIDLDQVPYYIGKDDFIIFLRADYRLRLSYSTYWNLWQFIDENGDAISEQKYLTSF